jgi:hypothetical protein
VFSEDLARGLDITCFIHGSKCLLAPAKFGVSTEIACGTGMASVEEAVDKLGLVVAGASGALEYMCFMIVDVLHTRHGFEEYIDRGIPAFRKAIYGCFSISRNGI